MFMRKQKLKVNEAPFNSQTVDNNQFLDDFLKPPPPPPSHQQPNKSITIKIHHSNDASKVMGHSALKQQHFSKVQIANQVKQILRKIRKQEQVRRQKTRQYLKKIQQQKQQEKKMHQFRIAQRRIKKRLLLIQKKQRIQSELLSFLHHKHRPLTNQQLKQKSRSLDDLLSLSQENPDINHSQLITRRRKKKMGVKACETSVVRQKLNTQSSQINMAQISEEGYRQLRRKKIPSTISAAALTKHLRLQQQGERRSKHGDYLQQLKANRKKIHTQSNRQLQKIYQQHEYSKQKSHRAVDLSQKIEQKRKLRKKNINDSDYESASNKLRLLDYLHRAHQQK